MRARHVIAGAVLAAGCDSLLSQFPCSAQPSACLADMMLDGGPAPGTLEISPAPAATPAGGTIQFIVTNAPGVDLEWSVEGGECGTIDAGFYKAPSTLGTCEIDVATKDAPVRTGQTEVEIIGITLCWAVGSPTSFTSCSPPLSPTVTLSPGEQVTFTATSSADEQALESVSWDSMMQLDGGVWNLAGGAWRVHGEQVSNAAAEGTYTSPATGPASAVIEAFVLSLPTVTKTMTITVSQ